jgi:sec-independent protein translocase protein TatC
MSGEEKVKVMPLTEHLEELRWRILKSLGSLILFAGIAFPLSPKIIDLLAEPVGEFYFFAPTEALFVRFKVAFVVGFAIAAPVILYQAWSFIIPALTKRERYFALPLVFFSTLLFGTGISFAYFILLPIAIKVLLAFGTENLKDLIGVSRYFTFVLWTIIGSGVVFELPVVIFFLTRLGLVTPRFLIRRWREAFLMILVLSAVITPSIDVVTQLLLALPLTILYLMSLVVSAMARPRNTS